MEAILIIAWLAAVVVTIGQLCVAIAAVVWWLVSPGKPEKRPMVERVEPRVSRKPI
jgi:hypothetical protein